MHMYVCAREDHSRVVGNTQQTGWKCCGYNGRFFHGEAENEGERVENLEVERRIPEGG